MVVWGDDEEWRVQAVGRREEAAGETGRGLQGREVAEGVVGRDHEADEDQEDGFPSGGEGIDEGGDEWAGEHSGGDDHSRHDALHIQWDAHLPRHHHHEGRGGGHESPVEEKMALDGE